MRFSLSNAVPSIAVTAIRSVQFAATSQGLLQSEGRIPAGFLSRPMAPSNSANFLKRMFSHFPSLVTIERYHPQCSKATTEVVLMCIYAQVSRRLIRLKRSVFNLRLLSHPELTISKASGTTFNAIYFDPEVYRSGGPPGMNGRMMLGRLLNKR